jgi:hypothetical protein
VIRSLLSHFGNACKLCRFSDAWQRRSNHALRLTPILSQRDAITHQARSAILVLATTAIINPVAIAHIEATLAAVSPDRVLHEPGKDLWK